MGALALSAGTGEDWQPPATAEADAAVKAMAQEMADMRAHTSPMAGAVATTTVAGKVPEPTAAAHDSPAVADADAEVAGGTVVGGAAAAAAEAAHQKEVDEAEAAMKAMAADLSGARTDGAAVANEGTEAAGSADVGDAAAAAKDAAVAVAAEAAHQKEVDEAEAAMKTMASELAGVSAKKNADEHAEPTTPAALAQQRAEGGAQADADSDGPQPQTRPQSASRFGAAAKGIAKNRRASRESFIDGVHDAQQMNRELKTQQNEIDEAEEAMKAMAAEMAGLRG